MPEVSARRSAGVPTIAAAARVLRVLAVHPVLWPTAARQVRVLARPRWWRHAPFLPVPSAEYLRFRLLTAYGGEGTGVPTSGDVVAYLEWCRAYPLVTGASG